MIKIYNRNTKKYDVENVAGGNYIKWCYESPVGKGLTELLVKKKLFSKVYGIYCDTKLSKKKVSGFIKNFDIDMSICKNDINDFRSFNDFFIRELNENARPIDKDKGTLISPGD
ncbi:phosphatidylserine decarboxylase, partial [Clostridium saudiense]|nr:phosphatidylserine decarboxylase [Clostridium saudiense]